MKNIKTKIHKLSNTLFNPFNSYIFLYVYNKFNCKSKQNKIYQLRYKLALDTNEELTEVLNLVRADLTTKTLKDNYEKGMFL